MAEHHYTAELLWTGNRGRGTSGYAAYDRSYDIKIDGKPTLKGSADGAYRGDETRHNPEDLLVAALSSCHMLWYLHLCADEKIIIDAYQDKAEGLMQSEADGAGAFRSVTLRPVVEISQGDLDRAQALHARAHEMCFIARSVNFPVHCEASVMAAD